jgi:hypothetical protein
MLTGSDLRSDPTLYIRYRIWKTLGVWGQTRGQTPVCGLGQTGGQTPVYSLGQTRCYCC